MAEEINRLPVEYPLRRLIMHSAMKRERERDTHTDNTRTDRSLYDGRDLDRLHRAKASAESSSGSYVFVCVCVSLLFFCSMSASVREANVVLLAVCFRLAYGCFLVKH